MSKPQARFFVSAGLTLLFTTAASAQFGSEQLLTSGLTEVSFVGAADLDGDGDQDVLAVSATDGILVWFENLGAGSFSTQIVISSQADGADSAAAADLDNDGDLDVVASSASLGALTLHRNSGSGSFGAVEILSGGLVNLGGVRTADVDGDGDTDVLGAVPTPGEILWVENLGTGTGPTHTLGAVPSVGAYALADLDFDGDVDVVALENTEDPVLLENLGAGAFAAPAPLNAQATSSTRLVLADVTQNGWTDVVVDSVSGSGACGYYPNLSGGSFGPFQAVPSSPKGVLPLHVADLDTDGDLDVVVAHGTNSAQLSWLPNLGFGVFGSANLVADTGTTLLALGSVNLDLDGDLELLTGSSSPGEVAWYANQNPPGTSFCTAVANSTGQKGLITSSGSASASLGDLVLMAQQVPDQIGIFFHGWGALTPAFPFGNGDLCIVGDLKRGAPVVASGNAAVYAYDNSDAQHSLLPDVGITRKFQFWFRDPGAGPFGFNLTSGFAIAILP